MGVDLDDPDVKKLMEMFEKEKELEEMQKKLDDVPTWRRYLIRALDPKRTFNMQRFFYGIIALNMAYKVYQLWSSVGLDVVSSV